MVEYVPSDSFSSDNLGCWSKHNHNNGNTACFSWTDGLLNHLDERRRRSNLFRLRGPQYGCVLRHNKWSPNKLTLANIWYYKFHGDLRRKHTQRQLLQAMGLQAFLLCIRWRLSNRSHLDGYAVGERLHADPYRFADRLLAGRQRRMVCDQPAFSVRRF